ncbi:hypothetical protein ACUXK4_004798 [Methylorubrum extorquens]
MTLREQSERLVGPSAFSKGPSPMGLRRLSLPTSPHRLDGLLGIPMVLLGGFGCNLLCRRMRRPA